MDLEIKDIKEYDEKLVVLRDAIAWFEKRHRDSKERIETINKLKRQVNILELQIGNWI
ncbi:hypothetical protein AB1K83_11840 [Sporosarcina sp. 179-K 3D1 HS]|uniref:hypothetical protein n=1 Tax=Sporosarcina sp. 179-K 3D1 HS TaxID=3232169 RepID=UPI00399F110E